MSEEPYTEEYAKIAMVKVRLSQLRKIEERIQHLINTVNSLRKHEGDLDYQLRLLESAKLYADATLEDAPNNTAKLIRSIRNELVSLREGVYTENVTVDDYVLLSGRTGMEAIKALKSRLEARIGQFEDEDSTQVTTDVIASVTNQTHKLPSLEGKEYVIGNAPVIFSLATKSGHSNVGYIRADMLEKMGFESQNLAGYTILHNQHTIGVPFKSSTDPQPALERAMLIKGLIEKKTNRKYEFVSDKSSVYKGGAWFWLMSSAKTRKLVEAFPGNQLKINTWGFGF